VRNLIILLRTYYRFFVFIILFIFCLAVFLRNNNFQYASTIHSARGITGSIHKKKQSVWDYLDLKKNNEALIAENAQLRSKLGVALKTNPLKDTSFSNLVSEDSVKQTIYYKYIPARVLNNSFDQKNNYITLNKGTKDNIRKNMSVVSANGIVGKVTHVTEKYCLANSMLSSKVKISCVTPSGTIGNVSWDSEYDADYVVLNGIPQSEKLKKGDTILTSGFSLFPKNVMIGRVVGTASGSNTGMQLYKIKLATNFRRLNYVYIVDDNTTFERTIWEDSVIKVSNEQ
jgi:rod shape-determining protein MreC